LLKRDEPISRAIELLDKSPRIVLVVDDEQRLMGTITDGDVRRGLIRHLNMDTPVSEFMEKSPKVGDVMDGRDRLLEIMRTFGLLQIPLLNADGIVSGIETIDSVVEKNRYDNPVFLMAGGFGKRLHPLTKTTPKPLLKVGSKPILQTILERFISAGFYKFYISTHYKAELLREHFGNGCDWDVDIEYVHEEKPLGTAGSLGLLPKKLPELPLVMMNGDLLTRINFESLLKYHVESEGLATMCVREYDFQVPYGVVTANKYAVNQIVEKPVHKFFVNAGIYVIDPILYRSVSRGSYLDMPDLLQDEIDKGKKINMFPIHEYWLDIGRMEDYQYAQNITL